MMCAKILLTVKKRRKVKKVSDNGHLTQIDEEWLDWPAIEAEGPRQDSTSER